MATTDAGRGFLRRLGWRLMLFFRSLRSDHPPAATVELERRADQLERRVRVLTASEANRAQTIVKQHGRPVQR